MKLSHMKISHLLEMRARLLGQAIVVLLNPSTRQPPRRVQRGQSTVCERRLGVQRRHRWRRSRAGGGVGVR